jgi:peptidoglycan hydrolase-like protein with peptidoglycan-binding domain
MVFNRVRQTGGDHEGAVYLNFTDDFTGEVAAAVRDFQSFSALPVNGTTDFATWCQLLVSTGDPDRPGTACDCITTITDARAQALKSAGYQTVGRYLDERPSDDGYLYKWIQPGELDTIFNNGLKVFPISQYYGGEVGYFTWAQGKIDAEAAHDKAESYGFRAGVTIYFGVDYDATDPEITSHIIPYFHGVVTGLANKGKKYHHGIYASRNVCSRVTRETYARWAFVSGMSPAVFINQKAFTVVGIIGETRQLPELLAGVLIPRGTAARFYGHATARNQGQMIIRTELGAARLIAEQAPLALRPEHPDLFTAVPPPDPRALRDKVTSDLTGLFLLLAAICLVIGAVGIANTTFVSVLERTGEIGLRRSLGARPRHIAVQFLTESTVLGLLGGMVGTAISIVIVVGVAFAKDWTAILEPLTVVPAPLIGALTGLLAGVYPALRAARIEPQQALRQ